MNHTWIKKKKKTKTGPFDPLTGIKNAKGGHGGRGQSCWHYYSSTGGAFPSREFLCRTAVVGLHPFPGVRRQDLDWAHNPHIWPLVTAESHTVIFTRVVEVLGRIRVRGAWICPLCRLRWMHTLHLDLLDPAYQDSSGCIKTWICCLPLSSSQPSSLQQKQRLERTK